jgi:hypothetical protein
VPDAAITAQTRGEVILRFKLEGRSQAVPALVGGASADPVTRRRATVRPLFNNDRDAVIEPLQGEVSA